MSSILEIYNKVFNRSNKDYRFTLSEPTEGVKVLTHAPDGWADAETTYIRHSTYKSVLRNTSTNELTFYKEGKEFIQNVYERSGIDANITFTVEKLNKSTWSYEDYPAANKIDLSTYMVDEIGVTVQLIDTKFKEKIINRESTEVDLIKRVSIEGLTVAPFTTNKFKIPDTSINLEDTGTFTDIYNTAGEYALTASSVTNTDFTEMQVATTKTPNIKTSSFFKESVRQRILNISGDLTYDIKSGVSVDFQLVRIDNSEVVQESIGIYQATHAGDDTGSFTINETVTVNENDSLLLQVTFDGTKLIVDILTLTVSEIYTGTPETDVIGFGYYEALLRCLQLISDTENPLYSELFGRTDTPLTTYASDGEIGFITKGIYLRPANITKTIPVKFKELFESLSTILRIGMSVKQIGGVDKVVIEDLDEFFDATVVVDLSDKLRSEDISKEVIPEMFYNECSIGFNKYTYEQNAGLFEFNTKASYTTVIESVFNKFSKISKYRADGQGMRLLLLASEDADYDSTKDFKGDDDLFIVDAVRSGSDFVARTNEDFDYIGGSVYASSSFNIRYSPARILRKWGADLRAGIKAINSYIRWQTTEKNSTLVSKLSSESSNVVENADVLVDDLNDNRWYNEKYTIESPLTVSQLQAIDANPNGLIKLADDKYGWILEMKTKNKDGMAEFELLRCNLNVVTPI